MQEKVTQKELMEIGAGETRTFYLPSELARHSARTLAYQNIKLYPRDDVERYSCESGKQSEDGSFPISITAVRK